MNKKSQNKFSAEEKFKILQKGEYGNMSINEVCSRHRINPNTYYQWCKLTQKAMLSDLSVFASKRVIKSHHKQNLEEENKRLKHTIVKSLRKTYP